MLSKVPEVTVWFWVIKILCTTVGVSFADWIYTTLGPAKTALIFPVVLAAVLGWQLRLHRYVPFVYWLVVVVFRLTGSLYSDILTYELGVPLAVSTSVFAAALAIVFGVWYARERTLSIHSIVTLPRESFYWLAVLLTFALGTAAGDWTLQLTGWGPGTSALLPAGLIVAIVIGWRLGANAVLSFWLAYILTRPLGREPRRLVRTPVNQPRPRIRYRRHQRDLPHRDSRYGRIPHLDPQRRDRRARGTHTPTVRTHPARERIMLGYYAVVAVATGALLIWSAGRLRAPPRRGGRSWHHARDYLNHPWTGNRAFPAIRDRKIPHHRPGHARKGAGRRPDWRDCPNQGPRNRVGRRRGDPASPWTAPPGKSLTVRSTTPSMLRGPANPTPRPRLKLSPHY